MIKQKWTPLRLQAKWYSNSFNCIMFVETTHLTQVEYYISLVDVITSAFLEYNTV